MRRRIYIDPESNLGDVTTRPYAWRVDLDRTGDLQPCETGALYDDDLWGAYQDALAHARALESEILAKLTREPLDDVEQQFVKEHEAARHKGGLAWLDERSRIAQALIANAETRSKP